MLLKVDHPRLPGVRGREGRTRSWRAMNRFLVRMLMLVLMLIVCARWREVAVGFLGEGIAVAADSGGGRFVC